MIELPTQKSVVKYDIKKIRLMLYGPPKFGKSTVCSGFPNVLFLATERGLEAISAYKIEIQTWKDFEDAVNLLLEKSNIYEFIVIDTLDELARMCEDTVCKSLKIEHASDATYGKGYDKCKSLLNSYLHKLHMSRYGLIYTSHTKVFASDEAATKARTITTLKNFCKQVIMPKVDSIGLMKTKAYKQVDGNIVEHRVITFETSDYEEAGDRNGILNTIISYSDPKKTYAQFLNAFNIKNKQFEKESCKIENTLKGREEEQSKTEVDKLISNEIQSTITNKGE